MTDQPHDNLDELRHIEGFPIGEDEDLHALSDPPHYTAYPNPHIAEFIEKWGKPYDEETDDYHREPYVADVSEGKGGFIYNAHTYHTKVPYKAIIPFIEHYTEPGNIVFDGFCGTGMTGIAAQMLGRRAILVDLSPAATFIAYNYNTPVDVDAFEQEASRILREVEAECVWMYETWHPHSKHPNRKRAKVNYVVWSDVFKCPYCSAEVIYLNQEVKAVKTTFKVFPCPVCSAELSNRSPKAVEHIFDEVVGREIKRVKQVPVLINYTYAKRKLEKKPDDEDLSLIEQTESQSIPYWFPTNPMDPNTDRWPKDAYHLRGVSHVHHFYTKRSLWVLSTLYHKARKANAPWVVKARLLFWIQSVAIGQTKMNRYFEASYSQVNRYLKGTLYIGPKISEVSPWYAFSGKMKRIPKAALPPSKATEVCISTGSFTSLNVPDSSIDYIFTDPPFGHNIQYSELNFLWEVWLRVATNSDQEAVINEGQKKDLDDYRDLMLRCFREAHRILKPGRWITVVFHNSKAAVWNAIQDSLSRAGFIVAQVATLDKQQATMTQYAYAGAVKNDLIINAYKPHKSFEERFLQQAGYGLEQEFVAQHLGMLPVEPNLERTAQMLYSKMLAYYVQHGYEITLNADQFYRLLEDHFLERDGYWFLDEEQVQEYERRKVTALDARKGKGKKASPLAQSVLFISDERSAIAWLYHFLGTPKSYSEIYTAFVKALQVPEDQIPEIKTLLEENFVQVNGDYKRPEMLEKRELEARRQQRLLREFEDILEQARRGQRLKDVRKEAVLAGFAQCYREKRFDDILRVGRKLHKRVVESSTEIYDFIDIAEAKVG